MSEILIKSKDGLKDIIIDWRGISVSNYDTSILSFTNHKDPHNGKALIGISPTEMRLIFSGIDPGSICDSNISQKNLM